MKNSCVVQFSVDLADVYLPYITSSSVINDGYFTLNTIVFSLQNVEKYNSQYTVVEMIRFLIEIISQLKLDHHENT